MPVRPRIFFDFSVDNSPIGRITFELFNESAPKTCEKYFRALCTGEKGLSPLSDRPLYYKRTVIHRLIRDFMIQGGDFTKHNGTGGESIYGCPFPDEDLTRPLDAQGLLCMANKGPNTNTSQFFITLRDCPHLNGKHVVFGRVIGGHEILQRLAEIPVDERDRPAIPVVISNCGEFVLRVRKLDIPKIDFAISRANNERESPEKCVSRPGRSHSPDHTRPRRKKIKFEITAEPDKDTKKPVAETEDEYDARLEREELAQAQAERRKDWERIQKRSADASENQNAIRFKGRGRMKFIDPEVYQRRR